MLDNMFGLAFSLFFFFFGGGGGFVIGSFTHIAMGGLLFQ